MTDPFKPSSTEPASIMVGGYVAWTIPDTFDPLKYTVKYRFSKGSLSFTLDGVYADNLWTFTADREFTQKLTTGRWSIDRVVTRVLDDEDVTVSASTIQCFKTAADRTSHAQIMVDKIESILSGRADNDVDSYTIKSRSISKMSVTELMSWREYYLAELGRQPDPITGKASKNNTVKVRFV